MHHYGRGRGRLPPPGTGEYALAPPGSVAPTRSEPLRNPYGRCYPAQCAGYLCPCVSYNGMPNEFCCRTCQQGRTCVARTHPIPSKPLLSESDLYVFHDTEPAVRSRDGCRGAPQPHTATCARRGCPCDSWDGSQDQHCSRRCRDGVACARRAHIRQNILTHAAQQTAYDRPALRCEQPLWGDQPTSGYGLYHPYHEQSFAPPAPPARPECTPYCPHHHEHLSGLQICGACSKVRASSYKKLLKQLSRVNFYDDQAPFYEFTNFYACAIDYQGKVYSTAEHAFQAAKFVAMPLLADAVRETPTARAAFNMARQYHDDERPDWNAVRVSIMESVLQAKFSNPHLRNVLLLTGDRPIVEHTANDAFWGDGGDGTGENQLGQLLVKTRAACASQQGIDLSCSSSSIFACLQS